MSAQTHIPEREEGYGRVERRRRREGMKEGVCNQGEGELSKTTPGNHDRIN